MSDPIDRQAAIDALRADPMGRTQGMIDLQGGMK